MSQADVERRYLRAQNVDVIMRPQIDVQRFGRSDARVGTAADATTSRPAEGQVPPAGRISQRRVMHRRDPRPHPGASHQRT